MNFIIDFYKELESLDLIIFWGIIIVIILLFIFSLILLNKNKKLKKILNKNNIEYQDDKEELPIKNENVPKLDIETKSIISKNSQKQENQENIDNKELNSIILPEIPSRENNNHENTTNIIKTENNFIAEEHVIEYNKDLFSLPNIKKTNEENEPQTNHDLKTKSTIEIPTKPYQRNVLREMSLSQTSPIGLTTPKIKEDKKIEIAKDLGESLNTEQNEIIPKKEEIEVPKQREVLERTKEQAPRYQENKNEIEKKIIKKELNAVENVSQRRTEIKIENMQKNRFNYEENLKENIISTKSNSIEQKNEKEKIKNSSSKMIRKNEEIKYPEKKDYSEEKNILKKESSESIREISPNNIDSRVKELLNSVSTTTELEKKKSSSEKYLEEVSRKLAEAEIPDEIERTDYELEQEENAIISYKELMEKKDSIQTIDEEEAIISIEELMSRNNQKQEENETPEDIKLYKLTEEEENDDFIKELKQFRNDL